ncbi:ABC transporter ATP-binding protein [Paracoccus luteus]|uniref:iron ABC transporter ATP-binding protein n=1 Tax=Paracoccus luteus TaxID=2508543 RepID=UPI00106F6256|nr:ATP-binding cassette domain-containing protein [Paracoccus luteus]
MIEIEGVQHRIGAASILSDIGLRLPDGKLTALIGPNGAGKSTLLRLIARLEPLQDGTIRVQGQDVATTPTAALARTMAIMVQHNSVASRLRVRELVGFGRWPHHQGRPRAADRAAVERALDAFGLQPLAGRFLDELSGGQAQRAYLAMTFAQDTGWLLLDEPLNNLDVAHARALMARLARLVRETGRSVVTVVHEVNYAAAWADHVVAMKNGRIVAQGAADDVLTESLLSDLYETPVEVSRHDGRPLVLHHHSHSQIDQRERGVEMLH